MTRLVPLLAATCAAVLLATSCTKDDPGPNYSTVPTTPTPTASPTATDSSSSTGVPPTGPNSSPGEVAPTEPGGALANSAVGAQAFASYYFKMLDWSYAVNRADLMDPLFAPACDNCTKLADNLSSTFSRGTVTGTRVFIKQIALVTNDGRGGAAFAVDGVLDISAGQLAEAGTRAPIPAESNVTITLWVKFGSGHWSVVSQARA